jgi:heme/copper-type cytochrome/quinol oxidase subunit 1
VSDWQIIAIILYSITSISVFVAFFTLPTPPNKFSKHPVFMFSLRLIATLLSPLTLIVVAMGMIFLSYKRKA